MAAHARRAKDDNARTRAARTWSQVADELGRREGRRVTPQRIRQIHDRAVEKLRASEMAGLVNALTEVA